MAYTKSLFFSAKGFASHIHISAGDDDLFVNQNATPDNTAIEIHPDAFVYSDAKRTLWAWFRQKKRHFGVGKFYKSKHKRMLSIDAISGSLFYLLLFVCLFFDFEPLLIVGLFIFRCIVQIIIYRKAFSRLDGKQFLWYMPILDVIYYIYLNIFGLFGSFIKTIQWK